MEWNMEFERLYINGEWVEPASANRIEVENPATMEKFAKVPASTPAEVDAAVNAAAAAFETWQYSDLEDRIAICQRMLEIFTAKRDEIIDLEVAELGTPRQIAAANHFDFQVARMETYIRLAPEVPLMERLEESTLYREPVGVVAAITPWNYPLGQVVQKIMPAILMGNTVVLKPSQHTPLTVYYLVDAFHEAGLPAGVLNLVTGRGADVGDLLAKHEKVDMVSFTGSTSGGIQVGRQALGTVKKVHLELGGKSPCVLLPEGDIDTVLRTCLNSCLSNCGQTCSALTRLIVPDYFKEIVERRILQLLDEYPVGDPLDPASKVGPLSGRKQFDKVKKYIQIGLDEGAHLLTGKVPEEPTHGYYVDPVVFTDVTNDMQIAREEIFGPVICLITYKNLDEALAIANDSPYGLSGAVCGPMDEAVKFARKLKTGNVYINNCPRDITAPFGGYKQSGIGREGGIEGIMEFTQSKVIFNG